ncbi:MAG: hypothetical protein OER90_10740 [Gemmatimonadota bacterium]|nr:hypothetical protein [Gemmatimonadota bacterium]
MKFKTLLIIKAIVCLGFGPILVFAPRGLLGFLGASLGTGGVFTAQEYGAAMFGTLMLTWFARNAVQTEARTPILLHLLVYDAIGFVVTVLAVLSGVLNVFGWSIVAVYLFFTAGSGYLLLAKPAAVKA